MENIDSSCVYTTAGPLQEVLDDLNTQIVELCKDRAEEVEHNEDVKRELRTMREELEARNRQTKFILSALADNASFSLLEERISAD